MSRLITHFPQNLEFWTGWKKDWRLSTLVILTNVTWRNSVVLPYRPPKVDWFLSFLSLVLLPSFQCSVTPVILFIFCARVSQRWCQLLAAPNSDWYAGRIFHEPIDDVQTSNSVSQSVMHGAEHVWGKVRESCLKELQDTNQKPMGPFLWVYFPCKKCACVTGEEESIQTFFALEFFLCTDPYFSKCHWTKIILMILSPLSPVPMFWPIVGERFLSWSFVRV